MTSVLLIGSQGVPPQALHVPKYLDRNGWMDAENRSMKLKIEGIELFPADGQNPRLPTSIAYSEIRSASECRTLPARASVLVTGAKKAD